MFDRITDQRPADAVHAVLAAADRLNLRCDVVCAAHTMGLRRQEGQRGSVSCERTDSASSSHNTSRSQLYYTTSAETSQDVEISIRGEPRRQHLLYKPINRRDATGLHVSIASERTKTTRLTSLQHFPPHFVLILGELEGSLLCYHMIISREM